MIQGKARKEQRRDGIDIWRHPNGNIGFEIGIKEITINGKKEGRLVFNGYHRDGYKLFELDPNRGLIAVAYTNESWTQMPLRKLDSTDESTIASEIQGFIVKALKQDLREGYFPYDYDPGYIWTASYRVDQNVVGYDYDNGTHPDTASYENKKGMKANNNDRDTNIANGWYMTSTGEIYREVDISHDPPINEFTVYVHYYQDGKITLTTEVTIIK